MVRTSKQTLQLKVDLLHWFITVETDSKLKLKHIDCHFTFKETREGLRSIDLTKLE